MTSNKSFKNQLQTVLVFTKINTKRFFRDRLAQFFAILFPLIFLFVFGSLYKNSGSVSLHVALVNESSTSISKQVSQDIKESKLFKIDATKGSLSYYENQMNKNQLDGIIVLPKNFGETQQGATYPSGQAKILYDESSTDAGQTLTTVLNGVFKGVNNHFVVTQEPFTVEGQELSVKSLTTFDYIFSGLVGFSIIGIGIFGPVNVFPELKKQGILRRLHTTPLRVWQYFTATMFSQAITGVLAIAIQFIVAIKVFDLKVDGNYLDIFIFVIYSIFMILGLGLAIGGWAKNERQAAPLSNIVVFPMLFLSGTFFPRYLMPEWLQGITNYLPLTPVIDGLRYLTTEGKTLTEIGPQLGLITVWFVIIYAIAFRVFKWE
ncbi:MAG TPA: ABC transporter permease [Candidatus Sulfotelmatobacter sp.]|nr:ABC transporter permease [Candidatus Sulfotelmatobacter sp.]